jgi:hypothetical protein
MGLKQTGRKGAMDWNVVCKHRYTQQNEVQVQQEQWMTKKTPLNGVKGTAINLTSTNHVTKINSKI